MDGVRQAETQWRKCVHCPDGWVCTAREQCTVNWCQLEKSIIVEMAESQERAC